jgi:hypothetical protein
VEKRLPKVNQVANDMLKKLNMPPGNRPPVIGVAISGGGYRSMT